MTSGPPVRVDRDANTLALDADLTIDYDEILKTVSDDMATRLAFAALASLAATALVASVAVAQDLEPRMYSNAPVGLNFLVAGYTYTDGGVSVDPSVPLEDGDIEVQTTGLGYARVLDVLGRSGKIDVIVPYSWLSGSATFRGEPQEREVEGFGDPRLRFSLNVLGAPALSFEEFQHYEQDVIVGVSLQVTAPLGQYDSDRLVNIGTNRWTVKPEIGISKSWKRLTLELATSVAFYSENDDFFGDRKLEKDPLYSIQAHAIYSIWRGVWAAFDFTYYGGGEATIDDVEAGERQENTRVGATLALPVNRYNSIKIYGSTGASARLGADFDTVGVAWQTRWGGGL
jgi:hypothetical protein